jgi:4'-phosphopantetheinyl transferase
LDGEDSMVMRIWTGGDLSPALSPEPPGGPIEAGHIHVWWLTPPSEGQAGSLDSFGNLTSAAERERARQFYFAADQWSYIAAQALLRWALAQHLECAAAEIEFERTAQGRPLLRNPANGLFFSLSHARGMVACALAAEPEIGVDVEGPSRQQKDGELASHFFDAREAAHLEQLPPDLRARDFFLQWTVKEAFLKAIGTGMHAPIDTLSVIPRDGVLDCRFTRPFPGLTDRWGFWAAEPVNGFHLAVAVRSAFRPVIRLGCAPRLWE